MARRNDASWRAACLAKRGAYCRACGSTHWLQVDHIMPRSQGGPSIPENGLVLCEEHHRAKTESRLRIERRWLDADQIAWLASVWWVEWWEGEPSGRGWRHFAPVRASVRRSNRRQGVSDDR